VTPRIVQSVVLLDLPLPPSVNNAFASRAKSHLTQKTQAYRFWGRRVHDEFGSGERLPVLAPGEYGLLIELPSTMKGDSDNRTKLLSDILRPATKETFGLGVVVDDRLMRPHYVDFTDVLPRDRVRLRVITAALWRPYLTSYLEGWA